MSKKSPLFFIPWAESLSNLFWMSRDLSLPKVFPWQPDGKGWLLQLWLEGKVLRIMISALAFWSKSVDSPATSDKTSGGELSYLGIPFNGNVVAVLQLTNDLKKRDKPWRGQPVAQENTSLLTNKISLTHTNWFVILTLCNNTQSTGHTWIATIKKNIFYTLQSNT